MQILVARPRDGRVVEEMGDFIAAVGEFAAPGMTFVDSGGAELSGHTAFLEGA